MQQKKIFFACCKKCAWILSCFGLGVGSWLTNQLFFLTFQLSSQFFLHHFVCDLDYPHPLIVGFFWCVCTPPINPMGIHLLRCVHGNECTWTHDAIRDTFVAIMWDVGFHVGWK
jgi:hypothetical protein